MIKILLVGLGGMVGSICRYLVSGWVSSPWLPVGTLTVNVVGCLLIGFLFGLSEIRDLFSSSTRLLLMVGLLGGFTTFSTFGLETVNLMRDAQMWAALANVALHVILGFLAVYLGLAAAEWIYG